MGSSFNENAFFDGKDHQFMLEFLKRSTQRLIQAGEFIYSTNQPADSSKIIFTSFHDIEGAGELPGQQEHDIQKLRRRIVFRRH